MRNKTGKIVLVAVIAALVAAFFAFDLKQYLSFEALKANKDHVAAFYAEHTALTILAYVGIYIVATALSLPGAAILTLAGGAIFGLGVGTVLVSFASTIGATLAFLMARFLLRDSVQARFGENLRKINEGIAREGAFYLFTLRLIPAFPFFVINLVMGLTPIPVGTFFLVSQVGMLPGTMVYVNAGTELAKIDSLKGILSPGLLISFALLGLFPLAAKKGIAWLKAKRGAAAPGGAP